VAELGDINIHIGDGNYSSKYPRTYEFIKEGIPFISASDFSGRVFCEKDIKHISEELHSTLLKGHIKERDILIVVRGNGCGKVGFVPGEYEYANINAQLALLRCDNKTVNSEFLYYLLSTTEYQNRLKALCSGSAQPQLPIGSLKKLQLNLPEYDIQLKIANIAKTIDDKILNNSAINRNLSEQSQMIVQSYMNGKSYEMKPLSDIAEIIDCLHSKKPDAIPDGTKQLIQLDNITDSGFLDMNALKYMISDDDYVFWTRNCEIIAGDCVITNVGRVGAVSQAPAGTRAAMGRNMTCIRLKTDREWHSYLITMLLSDHMKREINKNTDVGTIMNALNVKDIPKLLFPIFSDVEMESLENNLNAVRGLMEGNYLENQRLVALRDTLLPKLMSGELDVSDLDI
jgi:type I restriction enzyme S subunit